MIEFSTIRAGHLLTLGIPLVVHSAFIGVVCVIVPANCTVEVLALLALLLLILLLFIVLLLVILLPIVLLLVVGAVVALLLVDSSPRPTRGVIAVLWWHFDYIVRSSTVVIV